MVQSNESRPGDVDDWDELSEFLKAARRANGLTQKELAEEARMSTSSVATFERGVRSDGSRPRPRTSTWRRLANALPREDGVELLRMAGLERMAANLQAIADKEAAEFDQLLTGGMPLSSTRQMEPSGGRPRPSADDRLDVVLRELQSIREQMGREAGQTDEDREKNASG